MRAHTNAVFLILQSSNYFNAIKEKRKKDNVQYVEVNFAEWLLLTFFPLLLLLPCESVLQQLQGANPGVLAM